MQHECHFNFDIEEKEDAFNNKHQREWEWNWNESVERWKALGAFIGEYHYYPMQAVNYKPKPIIVKKFKNYEEERKYALSLALKTLEKIKL
jgi:hypothetical protein